MSASCRVSHRCALFRAHVSLGLYRMLEDAESDPNLHNIIRWYKDGKHFELLDHKKFLQEVVPSYGLGRLNTYQDFTMQLTYWFFQRDVGNTSAQVFYHAQGLFQRGREHLLPEIWPRFSDAARGKPEEEYLCRSRLLLGSTHVAQDVEDTGTSVLPERHVLRGPERQISALRHHEHVLSKRLKSLETKLQEDDLVRDLCPDTRTAGGRLIVIQGGKARKTCLATMKPKDVTAAPAMATAPALQPKIQENVSGAPLPVTDVDKKPAAVPSAPKKQATIPTHPSEKTSPSMVMGRNPNLPAESTFSSQEASLAVDASRPRRPRPLPFQPMSCIIHEFIKASGTNIACEGKNIKNENDMA